MDWPDFVTLPECKAGKHMDCPEWLRDGDGAKAVGCTCACHSEDAEQEEA